VNLNTLVGRFLDCPDLYSEVKQNEEVIV
jgi:hypothetical protein